MPLTPREASSPPQATPHTEGSSGGGPRCLFWYRYPTAERGHARQHPPASSRDGDAVFSRLRHHLATPAEGLTSLRKWDCFFSLLMGLSTIVPPVLVYGKQGHCTRPPSRNTVIVAQRGQEKTWLENVLSWFTYNIPTVNLR